MSTLASDVPSVLDGTVLDDALARYLVEIGRVTAPQNDQWEAELHSLMTDARHTLVAHHGTFLMGDDYVRLFRVNRDDLEAAHVWAGQHADSVTQPLPALAPLKAGQLRATATADLQVAEPATEGNALDGDDRRAGAALVPPLPARLALGAASLLLVAAVATVLIAAWWPQPQSSARSVAATESAVSPAPATPTPVDPADVAAAGKPAATYVAPPPPPTQTQNQGDDSTSRSPAKPRRHTPTPKQRTIPNPIPGLPPIVLPG